MDSEAHPWEPRPGVTETLNLRKEPLLDETDVQSASVRTNAQNNLEVAVVLTPAGTRRFAEATRQYAGRQLAMLVDGQVRMAPRVHEPITGSECVIAGVFTPAEAEGLAAAIRGQPTPRPRDGADNPPQDPSMLEAIEADSTHAMKEKNK
jgi:preprotein translocase subunit SecD